MHGIDIRRPPHQVVSLLRRPRSSQWSIRPGHLETGGHRREGWVHEHSGGEEWRSTHTAMWGSSLHDISIEATGRGAAYSSLGHSASRVWKLRRGEGVNQSDSLILFLNILSIFLHQQKSLAKLEYLSRNYWMCCTQSLLTSPGFWHLRRTKELSPPKIPLSNYDSKLLEQDSWSLRAPGTSFPRVLPMTGK